MNTNWNFIEKGRKLLVLGSIAAAVLTGCGGGGGGGGGNTVATSSATITPYKGSFSSGTVILKDANGNPVTLVSGGIINASGVAAVAYNANVTYPLLVEVTGGYFNEVTGATETATAPLRGIIVSANAIAANSTVPVTIVTEIAVADLQNRLGTFSSSHPITTTTAVAALNTAGTALGIPASTVPVFDPATHKTSDANTLRLAALAVVANNQAGTTLLDKAKVLADSMVKLGANAPTSVIGQTEYDNALVTVTSGASSMMAAGTSAPTSPAISTTGYDALYATYTPTQVAMVWDQAQATWDNVNWQ